MKKFRQPDSRGFTLIELLIVIIIIGILAAIAFVAYGSATSKAHKASAQSTVAQVKEKLSVYYADNSTYPATKTDFDNWLTSTNGGNSPALATTFGGDVGYTYTVSPTSCGDTVTLSGSTSTITTGSTACTGFSLDANGSASGSNLGFSGDIGAVTN